jgi:periplasmic divalent cation tolerance protein
MIIALSTYPDKKKAEGAAKKMVKEELAACVNILKIENSVYRWKGKMEKHPEYLLIIKTTRKAYTRLEMFIKEDHPHDVPEILFLNVEGGNKDYIRWVDSMTLSRLLRVPLDLRAAKRASVPAKASTKGKKPKSLSS